MMQPSNQVTDTQREYAALTTMRVMLDDYAKRHQIPFDKALHLFTTSIAYEALFDYETGLWREGPDYLHGFWKKCGDTEDPAVTCTP